MLRAALVCVALLAMCQTTAQAGLVTVNVDPFAVATQGAVLTVGTETVNRVDPGLPGVSPGAYFSGTTYKIDGNGSFTLTYNVAGGKTWGDVFATSGVAGSYFDGFSINTTLAAGSNATVNINGNGPVSLTDGVNIFRNVGSASDTSATFVFTQTSGFFQLNGTLSAVPEPSALLLVGSVLGAGFLRRRRS